MNKIKTRLFSIILCLAIAFSIVPVQADTTRPEPCYQGAGNCIHPQYGWLWDFR